MSYAKDTPQFHIARILNPSGDNAPEVIEDALAAIERAGRIGFAYDENAVTGREMDGYESMMARQARKLLQTLKTVPDSVISEVYDLETQYLGDKPRNMPDGGSVNDDIMALERIACAAESASSKQRRKRTNVGYRILATVCADKFAKCRRERATASVTGPFGEMLTHACTLAGVPNSGLQRYLHEAVRERYDHLRN